MSELEASAGHNRVRGYGRDPRPADVAALLRGSPFVGYGYAYPHKTAYRALPQPRPLHEVWATEDHQHLFLYVHVPFCGVRCGFCNLFTQKHPSAELPGRFIDTLARQIDAVHEAIPNARFARWALGGGTPTLLDPDQLERVFTLLDDRWGLDFAGTPGSVETSPETCTAARLAVLQGRGTSRISIGIQSFFADELRALGRPQAVTLGEQALDRIREHSDASLNIDLIYGIAGQTPRSFVAAIDRALTWAPEQLYLYPLYQRPLTGLGRRERSWDDQRLACLRAGRDHLLALGYEQVSMRMFRRLTKPGRDEGPVYCCQADGMIGLGVGARSYTRSLHYSDDWAVGSAGIREIVGDWIERSDAQLRLAGYGIELSGDEQRRRWLIQSLLQREGLSLRAYADRFGAQVEDEYPDEIEQLRAHQLIVRESGPQSDYLRPTTTGLEWADAIAPWLYSEAVRAASKDFELR
ncbi:putative radical SAM family enzyme [Enhygromyxa salina]|uniref:Putative radical SAM family enzyme n=1 Tax=Enhygromyxa salina TaxID=215803 RepID=A0A0C2CSQ0_9BACT|nr:STM4012 family radical SAM protein [Enhygromyxa salina]KIG12665.1 putative radical SAM family enzyme [Enhygromyxa salina]